MKTILGLVVFVMINFTAKSYATESSVGNGGHIVRCSSGSLEVLDFHERQHWGLDFDLGPADLPVADKITIAMQRLTIFDGELAKLYQDRANAILAGLVFQNQLAPSNDTGPTYINAGCTLEQAALQRYVGDMDRKEYIVDPNIWNELDNDQKAGLIIHETTYTHATWLEHEDSSQARYFSALLASTNIEHMTFDQFEAMLRSRKLGRVQIISFSENPSNHQERPMISNEDYLFWMYDKKIYRSRKDGQDKTLLVDSPDLFGSSLTIVGDYLVWIKGGYGNTDKQLMKIPITGGTSELLTVIKHHWPALMTDGNALYELHIEADVYHILKIEIDGTVTTLSTFPTATAPGAYIGTMDEQRLFITIPGTGPHSVTIASVDKFSGSMQILASGEFPSWPLAIDDDSIYWINAGWDDAVRKVPKSGGPVVTLAWHGNFTETSVVVIGDMVYWEQLEGHTSRVHRVSKNGGASEIFADENIFSRIIHLYSDGEDLYMKTHSAVAKISSIYL